LGALRASRSTGRKTAGENKSANTTGVEEDLLPSVGIFTEDNEGNKEARPSTSIFWFALCLMAGDIRYVTQKKIALDTISELPDEVSLDEIAERIEFLAAIQKGMDQLDRDEGIPHEEVKRQLATWLAS